jgi:L-alanine-DL-glutamate epimerase-like enolase superfamily enzyme
MGPLWAVVKQTWSRESWSLEVTSLDLPLAESFTIARGAWDVARNVFVTLRFAGVAGVGEASPNEHWGESVESVTSQLDQVDPARLKNPFNLEGVLELLPAGAARAALDIALHDLAGKIAGVPVCKLLGSKDRPLPTTSVTVPIAPPDEMAERARSLSDHPVLKVKVGFDGDVDVVASIRDIYDGTIRIDANEGWDAEQAMQRLEQLAAFDIQLCEQPVAAGNHDALAKLTESSPIPVFADEDACTAADVAHLTGVVDGVNLKLRKAGGIRETMRAIAVARAHDMKVMLGCDLESGIAITAAAHIAGLVDYADLDSPLLLVEDPFPGVRYEKGQMTLPDLPGLGVAGAPS